MKTARARARASAETTQGWLGGRAWPADVIDVFRETADASLCAMRGGAPRIL
ncbi:hypothetical protein ACN22W_36455 [Burkholderia theae]|uniref:hypothetical protein n=1 Tax=Burkholderia theae TaxID=3143496 RepID=UPI003AFB354F